MANFIVFICSTNLFPGDPAEGVSQGEREHDREHGVASARLIVHVGGGHSPRLVTFNHQVFNFLEVMIQSISLRSRSLIGELNLMDVTWKDITASWPRPST